mgnify:CR=1 FL=1
MYSSDLCWPLLYGIADSLAPSLGYNWGAGSYSRVKSIVKGTEVKFESLEDSLMDLANYSILMLIHLKELEQQKTEESFNPIEHQKDVYDYIVNNKLYL